MLRLIRWVLLLQKFNFEVKNLKETNNQMVNYLSHLEKESMLKLRYELKIDDIFPNEQVLSASQDLFNGL